MAGDRNLGMREMGGEAPTAVKAIITVDPRATRRRSATALVALVRELTGGLDHARWCASTSAPMRFATTANYVEVSAADTLLLTIKKEMTHDPSCGAMQWFKPFTQMAQSSMGVAEAHSFSGEGLGTKWSAPDKRSAFWGTFSY